MPATSKVQVGKIINQTVPSGTSWYKISYQNVDIDGLGEWDVVNHRFIAQVEGDYFTYLNFCYYGVGKGNDPLWGGICKNSGLVNKAFIAQSYGHQVGRGCPWGKCAGLVHLKVGDYLEAWTRNTCRTDQVMPGRDENTDLHHNNFIIFCI